MTLKTFFPGYWPVLPCKNPLGFHPPEPDPFSMPLPLAIPEEIREDQNPLPKDNRPIMLACLACKSVCEYTASDVQAYPLATMAPWQEKGQAPAACCIQFSCDANNCGAPLTLYVIVNESELQNPRLRDEVSKRLRDSKFFSTCPEGHALKFPHSNDFKMTWGVACWPPE